MKSPERKYGAGGRKDVIVSRVDLVRAFSAGGSELQAALAAVVGFEREPLVAPLPSHDVVPDATPSAPPEPATTPVHVALTFWQARVFQAREPLRGDEQVSEEPRLPPMEPVALPLAALASGAEILTRLRHFSFFSEPSGRVDLDRTVEKLSRGEFLQRLPRTRRKRWGQFIQVIADRSRRLAPFWLDQDMVVTRLAHHYPEAGFQLAILEDGASTPRIQLPPEQAGRAGIPDTGTIVLVLGDLGCLERRLDQREHVMQQWLEWGRRLRANGNPALAIVPCHPKRCGPELACLWTIVPWEGHGQAASACPSDDETARLTEGLLTRLAFALRIEPRLARAVRRLCFEGEADAGIESYLWQHEAVASGHHEAATLDPQSMHRLLPRFFRLSPEERRQIYGLVRELRRDFYPGVWYSELLALERDVSRGLLDPAELKRAAWWYQQGKGRLVTSNAANDPSANEPTWFRRVLARLPKSANRGVAAQTLHEIEALVYSEGEDRPAFLDPARLITSRPERLVALRHIAGCLVATPFLSEPDHQGRESGRSDDGLPGSFLALIRTRNGLLKLDEPDELHQSDDFWEGNVTPEWATAWGTDDFGAWVELRVAAVTQRLRWIPPGKFWMGSPEDEQGRFNDEGPRHEETVSTGFWIFDTPCTQALWEAVMGKNPSQFKGPDRPVESVSWDDCQEFIERLNAKCAGLALSLPSEVHWEYACRAGTDTPHYRQDLAQIAWYSENSGDETHPVAQLTPNDWGLFDTLGNVLEWCVNAWTDNYNATTRVASAQRVIRGGSWVDDARVVRAACRDLNEPTLRVHNLGFRCAEFRAPGPAGQEREAERVRERGAGCGAPGDRDQTSEARWIDFNEGGMDGVPFATPTPVRVSSDVEQVVLGTTPRPSWASAVGRDRYGLWAEFAVERKAAKAPSKRAAKSKKSAPPAAPPAPIVRQRLRWIPPGRFVMGSPDDEEGRFEWEQHPHEVTIGEGFWMFDTPCTQALWEALMGKNPSNFQSPDRPVEQVSWNDCQTFLEQLQGETGLSLQLPSEAQWEYACRAGTTTATYAGPLKIEGENNAPILDAIAWYGGNSGVEFELGNGVDATRWEEKQFAFDKAGTHPVARKKPNSWGLYDTLGNVWEWCADVWESDADGSRAGADSASARRVFRGGSWNSVARVVRAAYRDHGEPTARYRALGFRCAEFRPGL
ncbi:MAG: formylglycine-generating enzyme family protein [Isosphaeraceae bacterium]|nr:formylglycine-generating enzyme family protein [Isosphaeraceae bacterium]